MRRNTAFTQRRILDAVGRLVTDRGIEGIRVREIASEARMSPGTVLYHYPEQADLLLAVHEDTVAAYVEGRRAAASTATLSVDRLLAVARAGIPPWANAHIIRLLYGMHALAIRSTSHAELLSSLWRAELSIYADIITEGVSSGAFRADQPVEAIAGQLLALEDGLVLHQMSNETSFDGQSNLDAFTRVAARLLGCAALTEMGPSTAQVWEASS